MAGDGSEGQTVTRRKRVTGSKEVKNVSRKEKKTREVEGASEDLLKEKVTQETSADIQKELTEKLTGLLERDRLGGDGESVPETPPNEATMGTTVSQTSEETNPFFINVKIDAMAVLIFFV